MLTGLVYGAIREHVEALPEEAKVILRRGPVLGRSEAGYDCRVCEALDPIEDTNKHASELLKWHDVIEPEFNRLMNVVDAHRKGTLGKLPGEPNAESVAQEMEDLAGACAYARCCTIYALAGKP